jgi:hypothetical protein
MKLKCLIGLHNWTKLGGLRNIGHGNFEQRYKCTRCLKIKYMKS